MLDNSSVIPLYYQLKERLKEKIKNNTWGEHDRVPSERTLMEEYKVSRATVRKALNELTAEGLIYTKQGIGTFVSESKVVQNLIGEHSFNEQALQQGLTPTSKVIHYSVESNLPDQIHQIFKLNPSDEIQQIIRVRMIDEQLLIL